jgi:hypothetical protein
VDIHGASGSSFQMDDDSATISNAPSDSLPGTDDLLTSRGLDPEEWVVTSVKVNEWDSPTGDTLKQLTVNAKRRPESFNLQPAYEPDDYVHPERSEPELGQDGQLVVFVGDQQAPRHDPELHERFLEWLDINQPERGVLMGDTVDFPDISRHPQNPEWDATAQECINSAYLLLRDYVQASTDTHWTKLMGNHDERIRTRLLNHMTNLYGIRRADIPGEDEEAPVWCVSNLLRLKDLGIDFVVPNGGYEHAQVRVSQNLSARHGWLARKGSGASALSTLEHLGYSIVVGHTHRQSLVHKTTHDIDDQLSTHAAAETGCMCKIQNGLGYTVAPDWQNGFATAQVYEDGTFKIDLATYVNGRLYWRDQRIG